MLIFNQFDEFFEKKNKILQKYFDEKSFRKFVFEPKNLIYSLRGKT